MCTHGSLFDHLDTHMVGEGSRQNGLIFKKWQRLARVISDWTLEVLEEPCKWKERKES